MSNWINFLRQYGPVPCNDNMYDETIQRLLRKKRIKPIIFPSIYIEELVSNFQSNEHTSIVLTGTAGDGKTYCCRETWLSLGGSYEDWEKEKKTHELKIGAKTLIIIKDLSALQNNDREILRRMVTVLIGIEQKYVFLVAANDGQLVEALKYLKNSPEEKKVAHKIEHLLVNHILQIPELKLKLYNLSRTNAAKMLPLLANAILQHPGWDECKHCEYCNNSDLSKRCPIWENRIRMKNDAIFMNRLVDLLRLAELNDMHIPIRQLFILVVNLLLGHPDSKDGLLNCKGVTEAINQESLILASCYGNALGGNLQERRRLSTDVFNILSRFGIGEETNNRIDNILIFGPDNPTLVEDFNKLVQKDSYYGANATYISAQKGYMEGTEDPRVFLNMLKSQRQRLFFTIPEDHEESLRVWDLTTFKYAGEYLRVYSSAQEDNTNRIVIARLVKGFNRVSTGLLVNNQDKLILTTSGNYSFAKVNKIIEDYISVARNRGESVTLALENGILKLVVSISSNSAISTVSLDLTAVRYEFLCRVADGALPSSFSRECYEDILAFKARLLNQIDRRRIIDNESNEDMTFRWLEITSNGMGMERTLEVDC